MGDVILLIDSLKSRGYYSILFISQINHISLRADMVSSNFSSFQSSYSLNSDKNQIIRNFNTGMFSKSKTLFNSIKTVITLRSDFINSLFFNRDMWAND
jgi:hypothetical protein